MDAIYKDYVIDLSCNNNFVQVPAVQGDGNESRFIRITLISNNVQYLANQETMIVSIAGTKPDGNQILDECISIGEDGKILIKITSQMTAVAGRGDYSITLMDRETNSLLQSFPFYILVTKSAFNANEIVSSNEFTLLVKRTIDAENATKDTIKATEDLRNLEVEVRASEDARIDAENTRMQAEINREIAEQQREADTDAMIQDANQAIADAITATNNANIAINNVIDATADAQDATNDALSAIQNANDATANANQAANNTLNVIQDAVDATNNANQATTNANDATARINTLETTFTTNESNRQTNAANAIQNVNNALTNLQTKLDNGDFKGDKGDKGDTGAAFTYDMFTTDQLAALKGADGRDGVIMSIGTDQYGFSIDSNGDLILTYNDGT